jgi:osmotically-inducible protein OsmY
MEDGGKGRRWRGAALMALLLAGCGAQDADRLALIGRKVLDRLQMQTGGARDRLPDSLQSIRGGLGEFALDAKVSARLRWDKGLEGTAIHVAALGGGTVKLSGTVPDLEARQRAVHLANSTSGVTKVIDELTTPP